MPSDLPTPTASETPSPIPTAVSSIEVDLLWTDHSGNKTQFRIERCKDARTTVDEVATVDANVTASSDIGLSPLGSHTYRVWLAIPDHSNAATTITFP